MYLPKHFEQPDLETGHALIRENPLATLVTLRADGIEANHIPFLLRDAPAPNGSLQGHAPRANPLTSGSIPGVDALAIFHGPEGYITPSWYASKRETGKVVPTWNYAVVHAYGKLEIIDDAGWVRAQVEALTDENESAFASPWRVSDAPPEFVDKMIRGLVGIEIVITRLLIKHKASQNQPAANRAGVVEGLLGLGGDEAEALAALTGTQSDPES